MGEVLRSSVPICMKWNGVACQNGLYFHSNCQERFCGRSSFHSLCCSSGNRMRRIQVGICEFNVVPIFVKERSSFGCRELQVPQMGSLSESTKMRSKLVVSDAVSCDESELICQESKGSNFVQRGKDELDIDGFGQNVPPWGNLVVERKIDMGPHVVPESFVQCSTPSKKMVAGNESSVLYLEEKDVGELSRRMLMLSRSNKVRSAFELFRSMKFSGLQANEHASNALLSCLLRKKLLDSALEVFESMKKNGVTTGHTYSLILKAVAAIQGCDSALHMFTELEEVLREKKDVDVIVYNTMISVCGRANRWLETERIWRNMKENGYEGTEVTYWLLVSIFVRCRQSELAVDAYNEMVQNGLKPRNDTMQSVIGACAKEGKWELALNIFQKMLNYELTPNLVSCNALINSLGKAGEVKLAFKVFERVKSLGHAPDSYTWKALLGSLYRANQHVDALQLFESIGREQGSQLNDHLYNTALMSCQKLGSWEKAVQLLWQAEDSGLSVSTATYNLVIGACEIARKPKVALQVFEHMVHRKCSPDTFTYLSLIRGCIWESLWSEVKEILDSVPPDVSLYNAVIHGMCLRGEVESAKKLYMKMRESGLQPDGKTRALMLQNLRKFSTRRRRLSFRAR